MNDAPDGASAPELPNGPIVSVVCGLVSVLAESLLRTGWLNSLYSRLSADFVTLLVILIWCGTVALPWVGLYQGARHWRERRLLSLIGISLCFIALAYRLSRFAHYLSQLGELHK